jgi:outer membrane protein assembly factor BamD (BamD/ComL family)
MQSELALLDGARSAVRAGQSARALTVLDDFAARFPRAALAPEAALLRVEALARAGDRAGAERAARTLLAADPTSPYAERVRTLLASIP